MKKYTFIINESNIKIFMKLFSVKGTAVRAQCRAAAKKQKRGR